MGGGFAKFESPSLAVEAVTAAEMHQVPGAEIARSSMNAVDGLSAQHANQVEPGGLGYTPSYQVGGPPPPHHQPLGNAARGSADARVEAAPDPREPGARGHGGDRGRLRDGPRRDDAPSVLRRAGRLRRFQGESADG